MAFPIGHNRGPRWRDGVDARKAMLRKVGIADTITYAQMSEQLGEAVDGAGDGKLQVALRELERESIAFDNRPGEGYTRLDGSKTVTKKVNDFRLRGYRQHSRALRLSRSVDEASLPRAICVTKWSTEMALSAATRAAHGNSVRAREQKAGSLVEEERKRLAAELKVGEL